MIVPPSVGEQRCVCRGRVCMHVWSRVWLVSILEKNDCALPKDSVGLRTHLCLYSLDRSVNL